ncbi:hypothetical protein BT93_L4475 [Corymbia citriodora subsp. variegata]|uniref:Uncharacterized protein n=1 Tax=Corymbia citriodora subsp. variegata TaxID=360336 RepID=A0A8T0CFY7_CORYI|nr:hypothetical protein BT93_L4475 [Corymbia citriodora subsp. variegata]
MFFVQLFHIAQAALSGYGLSISYKSITQLQQYEEQSEKAAKYSGTAESQLHKTRTTQASAVGAILASFVISIVLTTIPNQLPSLLRYTLSPAALIVTLFARSHVSNFWTVKAKIPLVDGYNDAISKTKELMQIMEYLEYSWVATALVSGLLGY